MRPGVRHRPNVRPRPRRPVAPKWVVRVPEDNWLDAAEVEVLTRQAEAILTNDEH